MEIFSKELAESKKIAKLAGQELLKLYNSGAIQGLSSGKESIEADIISNEIVMNEIKKISDYRIISEEVKESFCIPERNVWIVDPLDGTKDFINRTGEFSVMIGFVKGNTPYVGAVYIPLTNKLFFAEKGLGAYMEDSHGIKKLNVSSRNSIADMRLIASRNHFSATDKRFADFLNITNFIRMGSAGIKLAEIACGNAEFYFNFDGLNKWDICAPQIILEESGGFVCDISGNKLDYNNADYRFRNGVVAGNAKNQDFFNKLKSFKLE